MVVWHRLAEKESALTENQNQLQDAREKEVDLRKQMDAAEQRMKAVQIKAAADVEAVREEETRKAEMELMRLRSDYDGLRRENTKYVVYMRQLERKLRAQEANAEATLSSSLVDQLSTQYRESERRRNFRAEIRASRSSNETNRRVRVSSIQQSSGPSAVSLDITRDIRSTAVRSLDCVSTAISDDKDREELPNHKDDHISSNSPTQQPGLESTNVSDNSEVESGDVVPGADVDVTGTSASDDVTDQENTNADRPEAQHEQFGLSEQTTPVVESSRLSRKISPRKRQPLHFTSNPHLQLKESLLTPLPPITSYFESVSTPADRAAPTASIPDHTHVTTTIDNSSAGNKSSAPSLEAQSIPLTKEADPTKAVPHANITELQVVSSEGKDGRDFEPDSTAAVHERYIWRRHKPHVALARGKKSSFASTTPTFREFCSQTNSSIENLHF